jgi:hypothetical protein
MQVFSSPRILQVRVRIRRHSLSIIKFHVNLVGSQHIKHGQVDHCLLPGHWVRVVKIFYSFFIILFYLVQSALVRHVSLPGEIMHGLHLQKYDVWLMKAHTFQKHVKVSIKRDCRHSKQIYSAVLSMILTIIR